MSASHDSTASGLHDCRDAFANTLVQLARVDQRIVAVVNDSVGSTKLGAFQKEFPDRLINVGIAEQDMVGVGAGLANSGLVPFVCAAGCFLTARALEQIKADVAYSAANVKLVGISSGMAYGELGPTHHSIEDFAWLRAIADLPLIAPADPLETEQAVRLAVEHAGPIYIRTSRTPVPDVSPVGHTARLGAAVRLREGSDVTIIANGTVVHHALAAARRLGDEGVSVRVVNMPWVTPLDVAEVVAAATDTGAILTVEEHTERGGLGGAVAEVVVQRCPVPMCVLGVPSEFAPVGAHDYLLTHFGLDADGITIATRTLLERVAR